jgi:hypothetical protein
VLARIVGRQGRAGEADDRREQERRARDAGAHDHRAAVEPLAQDGEEHDQQHHREREQSSATKLLVWCELVA